MKVCWSEKSGLQACQHRCIAGSAEQPHGSSPRLIVGGWMLRVNLSFPAATGWFSCGNKLSSVCRSTGQQPKCFGAWARTRTWNKPVPVLTSQSSLERLCGCSTLGAAWTPGSIRQSCCRSCHVLQRAGTALGKTLIEEQEQQRTSLIDLQ